MSTVPARGTGSQTLVIGASQAGLAIGYQLHQRGLPFQIVDAGTEIGETWRKRWDSLRLFTAAQYNNLPGMDFPGARHTYPGKDEIADFLQAYAARFELPVRLNTRIARLTKNNGSYLARAGDETLEAEQIVVATGPFQVPFVPQIADDLDPAVPQIHSVDYRDPDSFPGEKTLVVGGANSGCQIALELSESRDIELAVGQRLPTLPQRRLGRDLWWWLSAIGVTRITVDSRLGRRLSQRDVLIGGGLKELKRHGVRIRPRAEGASGRTVTFADGESSEFDSVIWATGFKTDHSWIDVPEAKDDGGKILHKRGVTPSPGLYMLGLTWMHTRTSALLGWVGEDAGFIAEQIAERSRSMSADADVLNAAAAA
jgi:putative flavoprotein involved in K+ transport